MKSLRSNISIRLAVMLGVFLVVMLGFGYFWIAIQGHDLVRKEENRKAELTARTLVASLKSIMLAGAGNLAHDWIDRIDKLPQVEGAKVFRVDGTEAFVDQKTINRVNAFLGIDRFHRKLAARVPTHIPKDMAQKFMLVAKRKVGDVRIRKDGHLTFLYPIRVETACLHCHGYTNNPLRGVLMLNISTVAAHDQLATLHNHSVFIFGVIIFLLMVGTWFGVRREVLAPLSSLADVAEKMRNGDFSLRMKLQRQDELGKVAESFDALVNYLVERIDREHGLRHRQEALTDAVIALANNSVSEQVLRHLGELAMEITRAKFAMLAYVDSAQNKHFIPLGISEDEVSKMGPFPVGKGLLGLLWDKHRVVRIDSIADHPTSVGFPESHPPMSSFLGAPIIFGDMMMGALYLTDNQEGSFSEEDEAAVRVLTAACAVALANARHMESLNEANDVLEQRVEERTRELSQANLSLRSHEVELELVNEELTRANEAKNQFLANTSHELRTPLNAIIGFSDLLSNPRIGDLNQKQERYVEHIHSSGKRLLTIINDLLDISKIEAGMMQIEESRCIPADIAHRVINELKPLADAKDVRLTLKEGDQVDAAVITDSGKLHQVLVNLVGNGVKFTDKGEVKLDIQLNEFEAGKFRIEAAIRDTGIGINKQDWERIFEPFVQAGGGLDRKFGGTGLGLALSRRQINMLGGNLVLESSRPGRGSCFKVELPVRLSEDEKAMDSTHHRLETATTAVKGVEVMEAIPDHGPVPRILVVDESQQRAETVISIFGQEGYQGVYSDFQNALVVAEQQCPFLIMLGINKSTEDLHKQLQLLKSAPATHDLPVILVGGTPQEPEFSMGTVGIVGDGFEKNELMDAVSRFGRTTIRPTANMPKVLVIDDDETVREFLKETLVTEGYIVLLAKNGNEGVRLAIEREPDLIILDLMMPGITGYEVLTQLRQHPAVTDIPVMIYTAKDLTREESLKLGSEAERVLLKGSSGRLEILRQLHRLEMLYPVQAHLIDATLGCFNERYFQRRLEQETANSSRHGAPFSLIGWEIDGYDSYVREHGERWGIVALKSIVEMVKSATRRGDVCAHIDVACFALFLPNLSPAGVGRVAEKIRLRIRHLRFPLPDGQQGLFTASFGAVHYGEDGESADVLLRELRRRIQEAGNAGGDQGRMGDILG